MGMFDTDDVDPFADASYGKAISFKSVKEGHSYTGTVTKRPQITQARDFTTKEPKFWKDGNPVQSVVVCLDIDGEKRSVWAQKPSSMFRALADAQQEAGGRIDVGDQLTVTWERSEPNRKNPDLNDAKVYSAKLVKVDVLKD